MATISALFPTTVLPSLIDSPSTSTTLPSETVTLISSLFSTTMGPLAVPTLAPQISGSLSAPQRPRKGEDPTDDGTRTRRSITFTTPAGSTVTVQTTVQPTFPKTLEAVERPTIITSPSPSREHNEVSRDTMIGIGIGFSLGMLTLIGIIILVFRYGKKTGLRSAPGRRIASL